MRWGTQGPPPDSRWSVRYVWRFAWLPSYDWLNGCWVWLERYAVEQDFILNRWTDNRGYRYRSEMAVTYDCRTEAPDAE